MGSEVHRIENQRPEHHTVGQTDAESRNYGRLPVFGYGSRFRAGFRLFANHRNIYMHYVLVWWFKERIQPKAKGFCGLVVYADDFVACFQYKWETERFCEQLKKRMGYFGLELQEDKSRLIKFGRFAGQDAKEI